MQALRKVLESVYSYFRYDVSTYIANQLEQEAESTAATCHVSRIQPQAQTDSDSEEAQGVPSPKDNKDNIIETAVEKKFPTKTISNFTVENILMNHPHSSSNSSHSPSSTGSSLTSPTDYSSVLPGNWISHPPVKYTKYTMLSPGSMGDDKTRKKNKVETTAVSNSRQRYHSSSVECSSSVNEPQTLTMRRVPSNPLTRVPSGEQLHYNFTAHPPSANGHPHHHSISKLTSSSSSDHKPVQSSSFTQSRTMLTKSLATLPVIQAVSYSPSGNPTVLQQAFPPPQQYVLLVPSTTTNTSDGLQAVVYANQAQSLKPSVSEQTHESSNHPSIETDRNVLDTYRPIAPKNKPFRETQTMPTSTSFDKKAYKRSPTTGKPQKLRFHMTTVVKRPKSSVVTSSMTVTSPSANSINERTKTTSFIMDSLSSAETHITKAKNTYSNETPPEMSSSTVEKRTASPQSANEDSLATHEAIGDHHTSPNVSPPSDNKKGKLTFVHCHESKQFEMPPIDNGRTTRSYTKRKRELTFHLYGDPETAFKPKRNCKE